MIAEPNICISPNIREYVTVSLGFVDVKIYLLDKIICKSMKLCWPLQGQSLQKQHVEHIYESFGTIPLSTAVNSLKRTR